MRKLLVLALAMAEVAPALWFVLRTGAPRAPCGSAPRPEAIVSPARRAARFEPPPPAVAAPPAEILPSDAEIRIVDCESRAPLDEAWVLIRWSDERDATRILAGAGGIVRVGEALLADEVLEEGEIGAAGYPILILDPDDFRAIFRLPPPGFARAPGARRPEVGLLRGIEITQRVQDEDGNPIEGARIETCDALPETRISCVSESYASIRVRSEGVSDARGEFRFQSLSESFAGMDERIEAEGFLPWAGVLDEDPPPAITLFREKRIEGRITDAGGAPIGDAQVCAWPEGMADAREGEDPTLPDWQYAESGTDGAFILAVSPRLRYVLECSRERYRTQRIEGFVPQADEDLRITMRRKALATARLVVGEERIPAALTGVTIRFPLIGESTSVEADGDGRIAFVFQPGEMGRLIEFEAAGVGSARLVTEALPDEDCALGELILEPTRARQVASVAERPAWIRGAVVDRDGVAVGGAEVTLDGESCLTDWRGRFELRMYSAAPGRENEDEGRTISVEHMGFLPLEAPLARVLVPDEDIDIGAIVLDRPEDVHGVIVIAAPGIWLSEYECMPWLIPEVDHDQWWIVSLPDGSLQMSVEKPGTYEVELSVEGYLPWRSPAIDLAPGRKTVLTAELARGCETTGLVVCAATGEPIADARLEVWQPSILRLTWVRTDRRGHFRISGLASTPCGVKVYADGYESARVTMDPGTALVEPIALIPEPGRDEDAGELSLQLHIYRPDRLPLASRTFVNIEAAGAESCRNVSWAGTEAAYWEATLPRADPLRFRLLCSSAGLRSEWLEVAPGDAESAGPIRVDLFELNHTGIQGPQPCAPGTDIRSEDAPLPIAVDLSSLGAIEGRIRAGSPGEAMAGTTVSLCRGDEEVAGITIEAGDRFAFQHIVPGSYEIRYSGLVGMSSGIPVEVRPRETSRVEIEHRLWTLAGMVVDGSGRPIVAARIAVECPLLTEEGFAVRAGGAFEIHGIPQGMQAIRVEAPGYATARVPVDLRSDRTIDVILADRRPPD